MITDQEREEREREYRQQYKDLILEATRIAVRGGLMSEAYEDFVIDYLDLIIDPLTNDDVDELIGNGKIPTHAIKPEIVLELLQAAGTLLNTSVLTDMDRENLKGYTEALEALLRESKGAEATCISEIDHLRARIFKAA